MVGSMMGLVSSRMVVWSEVQTRGIPNRVGFQIEWDSNQEVSGGILYVPGWSGGSGHVG